MKLRRIRLVPLLAALVLTTACASAGKRLEQGMEAEARGDYHTAVSRYLQALEKDPTLAPARESLFAAWESALASGLVFAEEAARTGDAEGAAGEFLALDGLMEQARALRVDLPTPAEYPSLRREALDGAIAALTARGNQSRRDGRWGDAREAYRRIVDDLDPAGAQRRAALDAQARALLEWAEDDARQGRFRSAFLRSEEALGVAPQLPADVADAATALQERALSAGLRILAVFPVGSTQEVRRASLTDLEGQLSDILETGYWRRPPLFLGVADPASVRQVTRRFSPPGSTLQPRRILEEMGADFGALVELVELTAEERDVRASTRSARTKGGEATSYTLEEGRIQYGLVAEITLFDDRGGRLESFRSRHTVGDRFRRARATGDYDDLDLSQSERLLFNPGEERRERALLQESLLEDLAEEIASGIFDRVVRRVP